MVENNCWCPPAPISGCPNDSSQQELFHFTFLLVITFLMFMTRTNVWHCDVAPAVSSPSAMHCFLIFFLLGILAACLLLQATVQEKSWEKKKYQYFSQLVACCFTIQDIWHLEFSFWGIFAFMWQHTYLHFPHYQLCICCLSLLLSCHPCSCVFLNRVFPFFPDFVFLVISDIWIPWLCSLWIFGFWTLDTKPLH